MEDHMNGYADDKSRRVENATKIISNILSKGAKLWTERDRLHYEAPKGAITPDELERIRDLKQEIIALLNSSALGVSIEAPLTPRLPSDSVPMTFAQRQYWKVMQPNSGPTVLGRIPVRVIGHLDIESLRKAFYALVRRHELLRTRILCVEGQPRQDIQEDTGFSLEVIQLTGTSKADRETEARRFVEQHLRKVDISVGPSFAATLLQIGNQDHILAIFWQHHISDLFSVGLLWRDIWTMYTQSRRGLPFSLPKIQIQPADYAVWEQKTNHAWMRKHSAYWRERLAGIQSIQLLADEEEAKTSGQKLGSANIGLDSTLTKRLREWSRRERSSLMMSSLTLYVALVARWCNKFDVPIFVTMWGRPYPEVENTVGTFAWPVPLRIQLLKEDRFGDLMKRVATEYDNAHEHAHFSRAQILPPELLKNTSFTWIPQEYNVDPTNYFNNSDPADLDHTIKLESFDCDLRVHDDEFEPREEDSEPGVLIGDVDGEVRGTFYYLANRATRNSAERFVGCFPTLAQRWIENPGTRVIDLSI